MASKAAAESSRPQKKRQKMMARKKGGKGDDRISISSGECGKGKRVVSPPKHAILSTYDSQYFISEKAESSFREYWQSKPVGQERSWVISDFRGREFGWEKVIKSYGWGVWAKSEVKCYDNLVREFLANAVENPSEYDQVESWVRGKPIVISADRIAAEFKMKRESDPEYELRDKVNDSEWHLVVEALVAEGKVFKGKAVKKEVLKKRFLPLFDFSSHNLCYQGKNQRLTRDRASLLYAISEGWKIDLPTFLLYQIKDCAFEQRDDKSIPFGGLISCFIMKEKLSRMDNLGERKPLPKIKALSVSFSVAQSSRAQEKGKEKVKEELGQEAGPTQNADFASWKERICAMETKFHDLKLSISADIAGLRGEMKTEFGYIEAVMAVENGKTRDMLDLIFAQQNSILGRFPPPGPPQQ